MSTGARNKYNTANTALAAAVALVTLAVYLPALKCAFVNWDDWMYLSSNEHIRHLNIEFLGWVFTNPYAWNYHPLTIISYAVDYSLWGLDPIGYHLENAVFHSVNTALVFALTLKVLGSGPRGRTASLDDRFASGTALLTALFFGVHPVHVESVAWVSERKDVLFMFFSLLSALFYLEYATTARQGFRRPGCYLASFALFLLALLSKPMAITLPVVFLILDFYPLERLDGWKGLKTAVLEKVPFFFLSAASAYLTVWAQREAIITNALPLGARLLIAAKAYSFYLYKMLLPTGLAPYYPNMGAGAEFSPSAYTGYILVFILLTAVCAATVKRHRFLLAVWLYYVVTLLPVVGIIQVGGQAAADRYAYSPSLAPFMLAGAALSRLYITLAGRKALVSVLAAAVFSAAAVLCVLTVRQVGIWKDSETLWTREIEVYPIVFAYRNRANYYFQAGRFKDAIEDYSMSMEPDGGYSEEVRIKRGISYLKTGEFRLAAADFSAVIATDPRNINAYNNRGNAFKAMKDYPSAIKDYESALALAPDNAVIYFNIGAAYMEAGRNSEAVANIKKAAALGLPEAAEYLRAKGL